MTSQTLPSRPPLTAPLDVYLLGTVDFASAVTLQNQLLFEVRNQVDARGTLLLCEHSPVLTIGRAGSREHLLVEPHDLVARQVETHWVNRGGGCLIHSPGQLAIYPILPLQRLGLGLAAYRELLERTILEACRDARVDAWQQGDLPGVYARSGQLAYLGVAVKDWISYHGAFLNVRPDLVWQQVVQASPCEIRPSSLEAERLKPVSTASVREAIVRHLAANCGYSRYHVYTSHPELTRTRKVVAYSSPGVK